MLVSAGCPQSTVEALNTTEEFVSAGGRVASLLSVSEGQGYAASIATCALWMAMPFQLRPLLSLSVLPVHSLGNQVSQLFTLCCITVIWLLGM